MRIDGATVFLVNEPVVVQNDSSFGFDEHTFHKSDDMSSEIQILADGVFPGQTFAYSYSSPAQSILSLTSRKIVTNGTFYSSIKSITFSVGYFPSIGLTYSRRVDQISRFNQNCVVYGRTFEFTTLNLGPQDNFQKTYQWNFAGGISGSSAQDSIQKLTFLEYGQKTVGLTVQSIIGSTFASIDFYSIGTPIVGITSNVNFGAISDNTPIHVRANVISLNGHNPEEITYYWTIFGKTYSGISASALARDGQPNNKVILKYYSKVLAGLSGMTFGGYSFDGTFISENIPLYVDFREIAGYSDTPNGYNTAAGYSGATFYVDKLVKNGCIDCRWVNANTYESFVTQFNGLTPIAGSTFNPKKCVKTNIEIPFLNILAEYYRSTSGATGDANWIRSSHGDVMQIEWIRQFGSTFNVEPQTNKTYAQADIESFKNLSMKLWADIAQYVKQNGGDRVMHYMWPNPLNQDKTFNVPPTAWRGVIYPRGVCADWYYINNPGDPVSANTPAPNVFINSLLSGFHKSYIPANVGTSSYLLSNYNYLVTKNILGQGSTFWIYGWNGNPSKFSPTGSPVPNKIDVDNYNYWSKISQGNVVQANRAALHYYGVTYANITPSLCYHVGGPRTTTQAFGSNKWEWNHHDPVIDANVYIDGFFGDRNQDSMELFDPYSRPNDISFWYGGNVYSQNSVAYGNWNSQCPAECTPPGAQSTQCHNYAAQLGVPFPLHNQNVLRCAMEKTYFGRPALGQSGISGTIGDEPIGSHYLVGTPPGPAGASLLQQAIWAENNNLGNTFWASFFYVSPTFCTPSIPNENAWWLPTGGGYGVSGSLLPAPCSIGPSSPLAPWLNFNQPIRLSEIRVAIRHYTTNEALNFIQAMRNRLNTVKPKRVIPMYGDYKSFIAWSKNDLLDPSTLSEAQPYIDRIQNVLTNLSTIGIATYGDIQTGFGSLSAEEKENVYLDIKYPWVAIAYESITGPTAPHMIPGFYERVQSEWQRQRGDLTGFAGATIGDLKDITARLFSDCISYAKANGSKNVGAYQRAVGMNGISGQGLEDAGAGIPFAGLRGNSFAPQGITGYLGGQNSCSGNVFPNACGDKRWIHNIQNYTYWQSRTGPSGSNMTTQEYVNVELSQKRYDTFIRGLSAAGIWTIPTYNPYPNIGGMIDGIGTTGAVSRWKTIYPVQRISKIVPFVTATNGPTALPTPYDLTDLNYWAEKNMIKTITEFRRGLITAGATTGIPKISAVLWLSPLVPTITTFGKLNHWGYMKDIKKAAVMEIRGLFSHVDTNFPYLTYPDQVWFWDNNYYFQFFLPTSNAEQLLSNPANYDLGVGVCTIRNAMERKLFNRPYPQDGEPIGYTLDQFFDGILGITLHNNWFINNNLGTSFWKIEAGTSGITWWDPQNGSLLPYPCSINPIDGPLSRWLPQGTTLTTSHVHRALKHYLSDEYCTALETARNTMNELFGNKI